jgi:hypothetical protein
MAEAAVDAIAEGVSVVVLAMAIDGGLSEANAGVGEGSWLRRRGVLICTGPHRRQSADRADACFRRDGSDGRRRAVRTLSGRTGHRGAR